MNAHGLLGHIVTRFSEQSENLATESLNHILNTSSAAKESLVNYLKLIGIKLHANITIRTQTRDEDFNTPDLVGFNNQGKKVMLIESKFWAGLTENQPVSYLRSLPKNINTSLIILAPLKRFPTLWAELLRRLKESNIKVSDINQDSYDRFILRINENQIMALLTWRSVLSYIHNDLVTKGEADTASDVMQLIGLCDRMDEDALLPIRPEELSSHIGTRIAQYSQMVDVVVDSLVEQKIASIKRMRSGSSVGIYGRYMKIHGFGLFIQFNAYFWKNFRETPLWLNIFDIKNGKWIHPYLAKECLMKLKLEEPPRLIEHEDKVLVPLFLPTGVEEKQIIESVIKQIKDVAECLRKVEQKQRKKKSRISN